MHLSEGDLGGGDGTGLALLHGRRIDGQRLWGKNLIVFYVKHQAIL